MATDDSSMNGVAPDPFTGADDAPATDSLRRWTQRLDARADAFVDHVRSPALDRIMYPLSSAADHSVLWHALGAWRALRTGDTRNARRLGLILGAESALTNGVIKSWFRRVRPTDGPGTQAEPGEQDGPLPYGLRRPVTSSFPSGHATAAFTAAVVLADARSAPFYFGLAAAVAASRVYVRLHHASDVVAGAALGCVFGIVARRILPVSTPRRVRATKRYRIQ
ncbi:MAG: phosphatase PAP2 family protein [Acidimicrobiia bacterium]